MGMGGQKLICHLSCTALINQFVVEQRKINERRSIDKTSWSKDEKRWRQNRKGNAKESPRSCTEVQEEILLFTFTLNKPRTQTRTPEKENYIRVLWWTLKRVLVLMEKKLRNPSRFAMYSYIYEPKSPLEIMS